MIKVYTLFENYASISLYHHENGRASVSLKLNLKIHKYIWNRLHFQ